jgi:uncharacterized protein (DUF1800 family)
MLGPGAVELGLGGHPVTDDDARDDPTTGARWGRRAVIVGLAGTGAGAATLAVSRVLPASDPPAVLPDEVRRVADRPADAGGFANRDESYANSIGPSEQISATDAPSPPPPPTLVFPTAAEAAVAAAAVPVTTPTLLDGSDPIVHLLRRASFGPTPELVDEVRAVGLDGWIAAQLAPESIADPFGDAAWAAFPLASADPSTIRASIERRTWGAMQECSAATMGRQLWSSRQLYEVMVDFWANHLNVPTPGPGGWDVGCNYQTEVIRRHALGSFSDMLLAAGRHPAMLRYLTASDSKKDSVNENLGRELLELHTVGVDSGYTEDDVRHSAYILTGRTLLGDRDPDNESDFHYEPGMHWVGPVTVLDFSHDNATAEGGLEVGDAYLRHLAVHPATAKTIARKLAVRFVSDVPPPSLVDRLAAAYLDNDTAVVPVLDTLFRSIEFWTSVGLKTRRPLENITASTRILGLGPTQGVAHSVKALHNAANRAGHRPLSWQAPNGYPDVHAAWRSSGSIVELWNVHRMLVGDWQDGLTRPDIDELLAGRPAGTVGEYVDSLCERLCFQTFQPAHRDALVAFLGGDAEAPLTPFRDDGTASATIALVLDSPYFVLR